MEAGDQVMRRKRGEPVDLITELEALRKLSHDRLQVAEYQFFQAERALETAKRLKRMREAGNE
jgi:hypothetical protein